MVPPWSAGAGGERSVGPREQDVNRIPMTADNWTWSFEKRIASEASEAGQLIDLLLSQLIQLGWQDHDAFGVHLALEEALANAIKHGNRRNAAKFIKVAMHVSPDRARIEVEDEGVGFDPNVVPDPTDERNLELPTGRGLMLMRSYMNSVSFSSRGNRVVMEKQRTPNTAME
jgi:serine/threonine-protein kinase RsbW